MGHSITLYLAFGMFLVDVLDFVLTVCHKTEQMLCKSFHYFTVTSMINRRHSYLFNNCALTRMQKKQKQKKTTIMYYLNNNLVVLREGQLRL